MNKKLVLIFLSLLSIVISFSSCGGDDDVSVSGIKLDKTTLSLLKGESGKLTATISPEDATNKTINWTSSNTGVATVDINGNVTALSTGTSIISATSVDGKFSASCTVTVSVNVSSISLSQTSVTLEKGQSVTLTATVLPNDASNKDITWTSSDINIVSVDGNGNVFAVNGGQAEIIVNSADGNVKATCNITVIVPVQNVSLDKTELSLIKGQQTTLVASILPEDATTKDVTWTSSDNNVVSVDKGTITAIAVGTATITVTTADGNKTASCQITVNKSETIGYDPYGDGQQW